MSGPATPTYKTLTWPLYDKALKRRGSLSIWFDSDMARAVQPTGKRGRQPLYSDAVVQTCLTLNIHWQGAATDRSMGTPLVRVTMAMRHRGEPALPDRPGLNT